jgi:predicted RNA-binding Zn-ribbon protein involved in translation (DUF1610 family)
MIFLRLSISLFCYNFGMESDIPESQVFCTQCGGELHPDEGQSFLTCPFCGSAVYLDKSRVVFHWYLASTLDEARARSALARWMAGNQTVKDLDKKSRLLSIGFEYFPLWYFKRRQPGGKELLMLEPASATSISELRRLVLPAGDLRKYDTSLDSQAHAPSVPLQAALDWLSQRQVPAREIIEQALVHIPLFTCKYAYQDKEYTAVVEGATGAVFANIYPPKSEAPYLLAGGLTGGVFLCLASFPVIGALAGEDFSYLGLAACVGVGLVAAPILFALAAWVAAKI